MGDSQKDKKRDDVLKRMLSTPPDPRKAKKGNASQKNKGQKGRAG